MTIFFSPKRVLQDPYQILGLYFLIYIYIYIYEAQRTIEKNIPMSFEIISATKYLFLPNELG